MPKPRPANVTGSPDSDTDSDSETNNDVSIDKETDILLYGIDVEKHMDAYKAFTWNPNPSKYSTHDPVEQYKCLLQNVLFHKNIKKCFTKFIFVPELTEQGNVHVHGCYNISQIKPYARWFLPACKRWGYTLVKPRVDENWVYNYMSKSANELAELFEDLPLPLTEENWDDEVKYHTLSVKYTFTKLSKRRNKKVQGMLKYINNK